MNYREAVFVVLVSCFALSLVWYGYSVRQAIVNVVQREAVVKQIQQKSSEVADLETKYFTLKNGVSIELAHKEGFREAPVSMFISKKSLGALTYGNHI
ncbi:MAG: hypothetical protein JWO73_528 [Candidatus Taylorbacteria bacterium]|nr:hypothetical protein [Candidatus Taylorbacteria bacterium]